MNSFMRCIRIWTMREELSMEEDIEFFEEHNGKVISFADQNERFKQRLLVWRTRRWLGANLSGAEAARTGRSISTQQSPF